MLHGRADQSYVLENRRIITLSLDMSDRPDCSPVPPGDYPHKCRLETRVTALPSH
jgi:hypothetical protein